MRVVLEMILTSANMFVIDTSKDLQSYQETMSPSMSGSWGRYHVLGDAIMSGPWAQWGWGFFGPYNSSLLIRARFLGTNKGTRRAKGLAKNSNGKNWVVEASINALSKGVPFLAVRLAVIII